MSGLATLDWAVVMAYFAITFGVAWWAWWREHHDRVPVSGVEDYFLANRNVGWFVVGASVFYHLAKMGWSDVALVEPEGAVNRIHHVADADDAGEGNRVEKLSHSRDDNVRWLLRTRNTRRLIISCSM